MTTHKSDAVSAGVMPDMTKPGLVLCRTGSFVSSGAGDSNDGIIASGDTVQMVPIPAGARILDVHFYCSGTPKLSTDSTVTVGDGGDTDRYIQGSPTFVGDHLYRMADHDAYSNPGAGYNKLYSTDDTIDILFSKIESSSNIPTGITFKVSVFYKMTGSMADED